MAVAVETREGEIEISSFYLPAVIREAAYSYLRITMELQAIDTGNDC